MSRLPPHSHDAELAVLDCILLDAQQVIPKCQQRLSPESFYDVRHRLIYEQCLAMAEKPVPVDFLSLLQWLSDNGLETQVGGRDYLSKLGDSAPSAAGVDYWLNIVAEKHCLRQLLAVTTEIQAEIYHCADVPALLDDAERKILAVRPKRSAEEPKTIKELARDAITEIQTAFEGNGKLLGISSGFSDLDALTGGLVPGEMTIIAAKPSCGKTSLAMNIAEHVMLEQHRRVGVNSLEMTGVELVKRFISSHSKVNLKNVYRGFLRESDFQGLFRAATTIAGSAIYIDDASDLSIYQLRPRVRRMWQQHKIELWIVDYIQLLNAQAPGKSTESREQEVNAISRGIKATAKEFNIPVIALSQLNEDGQLRESRAIGMHADNVWMLEEKSQNPEVGTVELFISKNRNGPRFETIHLTFFKTFTRFEQAAKITEQDTQWKGHND